MAGAFQTSCFQDNAYQVFREIASTAVLQKPVNCVMAGDQLIIDRYREWSVPAANRTESKSVLRSRVGRVGGNRLSGAAVRNAYGE